MLDYLIQFFQEAWPFILAGFFAQLIDGALGMAYGVISSTILVSVLGVPPLRASSGIHLAKLFTSGASGIAHILHKNVDWHLLWRLAIPGIFGGIAGAILLARIHPEIAKPFVMAYLTSIGIYLMIRGISLKPDPEFKKAKITTPLGLIGGFLDAIGGGGWGPVVTSNLLIQGVEPRKTIGTVNAAEFIITCAISTTFIIATGFKGVSTAIIGLILGGLIAAPFGAILTKRIPARPLLMAVGFLLTLTSLYSLYRAIL